MKKQMTWLDLYTFLYEKANDINGEGNFVWGENVTVFDFETLEYYNTDFIQMPDEKITLSVDTSQSVETTNGS